MKKVTSDLEKSVADNKIKKIGLLGGSFNPPHLGHIQICHHIFDRGLSEEIWVVPCYAHPFQKELAPFADRLAMCKLAFKDLGDKVQVSEIEKKLGGISHTVRTIEHLKLQFPDISFGLIVGSDISKEKDDWKDFERIENLVDIIEVPRRKDSPIIDISSTEIRSKIKREENVDQYVLEVVVQYIKSNQLYKD